MSATLRSFRVHYYGKGTANGALRYRIAVLDAFDRHDAWKRFQTSGIWYDTVNKIRGVRRGVEAKGRYR